MPSTVGGVASEGENVYAMLTSGRDVHVLSASSGSSIRVITLDPLDSGDPFNSLSGGLFVVQSKLFRGTSTTHRTVYR